MISSAQQGYLPVGIDIKLEPLQAARRVMEHHNVRGFVVAADLRRPLPFRSGVFDQIYSYSVIQHVHRDYARECVRECARILRSDGTALLEFPIRHGLTNFRHRRPADEMDPESWCVRYYSFRELRQSFQPIFGDFGFEVDCYFGIGIRPEDRDLLPWQYKIIVTLSEALKSTSRFLPPLRYVSDSVFVCAGKPADSHDASSPMDVALENGPGIFPLLQCPLTGAGLEYDAENGRLISRPAGKAYPIVDGIPVMIPEEAISI
jgi:uncharacterized protein YbaR (Trm112 family)/SAM-dependent methyltransferase